jgi:magnesium transporter
MCSSSCTLRSRGSVVTLIRNQEEYVETVTSDVWRLEQRVTSGRVDDPKEFLDELFRARHGLLAVRTMGALGAAIYGRMTTLTRVSADGRRFVADIADQLDRVRSIAEGQKEYLQGVIEFYQTTLTINAAIIGHAQSEEVKRLTEAGYAQTRRSRRSPPGRRSSSLPRSSAPCTG